LNLIQPGALTGSAIALMSAVSRVGPLVLLHEAKSASTTARETKLARILFIIRKVRLRADAFKRACTKRSA